jgi:hypothetical protein
MISSRPAFSAGGRLTNAMFRPGARPALFRWLLLLWLSPVAVVSGEAPPQSLAFTRDIRPILAGKCYPCHGPDERARKAGLRLDQPVAGRAGRSGRPLVVATNPPEGELLRRIISTDPDVAMPPAEARHALSQRERTLLERWAAQGAPWEEHWAFVPPKRREPPPTRDRSWPLNAVDAFILHRLEAAGEKPSPEADRRVLLRRASFDLTGLPPPPAEVEPFAQDRSPRAFEQQVARMLASPRFGERMAMLWLDLVRYADTDGYHADNPRPVSPYRDYVIAAFNDNMPFDRFTLQQLAGDLLPNPGRVEAVASAYNQLVKTTEENGANEREYLLRYAADRVRNVSSVWLGLTLGCAECHDHKSDPLTARDFYRFSAFFADLQEKGVGRREAAYLPTDEQRAQLARIHAAIDAFNEQLARATQASLHRIPAWVERIRALRQQGILRWAPVTAPTVRGGPGQTFETQADGFVVAGGSEAAGDYELEFGVELPELQAVRLEVRRNPETALRLQRQGLSPDFHLAEVEMEILFPDGRKQPAKFGSAYAEVHLAGHDIRFAFDGRRDTTWAVGSRIAAPLIRATAALTEPVTLPAGTRLRLHLRHAAGQPHSHLREFRLSLSPAGFLMPDEFILPADLLATLARPGREWSEKEREQVLRRFQDQDPELHPLLRQIPELEARQEAITREVELCLISRPGPPRITRVLPRGNWMDESGEIVEPGIPALFGNPLPAGRRASRLDLARWLVARDNPLTARVFVNRLWRHFFGAGLVRTLNDFGITGDPPSHPELLDSLAVEFMESGWDVKRLVNLLVTSRTYRQSSVGRPDLEQRDPDNRLFARQGRWRLEAELLRDQALFVAGCLDTNVGGAHCLPYQPAGHLDQLDFPQREYHPSTGPQQYRRGLYVFRQRSFPHPALTIFDAPSREECVAERPVSNNPLQALALLNDPSQVEPACLLADRVIALTGGAPAESVELMMLLALNRSPTAEEGRQLQGLYERQLERLRQRPADAGDLLAVNRVGAAAQLPPEQRAAWTAVARALLNLHETITRY